MSHLKSIQKINVPRVPLDRDTFRRNFMRELAVYLQRCVQEIF
jgi:hypothetical protein